MASAKMKRSPANNKWAKEGQFRLIPLPSTCPKCSTLVSSLGGVSVNECE